jgi:replicative superfamily II helicase
MDEYVKMMSNRQNVESHLVDGLDNCINAEIAAGAITTVTEGVQWLKKSFFFQRVKRNPIAYGVKYDELQLDPTGHMILLERVTKSVERLNRM